MRGFARGAAHPLSPGMSTAMKIGGGEATEKESSGGFQFEAVDFEPCFVKEHEIKVRLASLLRFPARVRGVRLV